jgi:hypothetical protein
LQQFVTNGDSSGPEQDYHQVLAAPPPWSATRDGLLGLPGGTLPWVFALVKAPDQGLDSERTIAELVHAGVLLTTFLANELRSNNPLVPPAIRRPMRGTQTCRVRDDNLGRACVRTKPAFRPLRDHRRPGCT